MTSKQFNRELAKASSKRVPNSRMTFAELAALSTSYTNRMMDERAACEAELRRTGKLRG